MDLLILAEVFSAYSLRKYILSQAPVIGDSLQKSCKANAL